MRRLRRLDGRRGNKRGCHYEWKKDCPDERDNREEQQSIRANTYRVFPGFICLIGREIGVGGEVGINFQLTDVRGLVVEESEPTEPIEELGFTDFPDLWRQTIDGVKGLAEECKYAWIFKSRATLKPWVAFLDVGRR